jgi:hypothetical protein
VIRRLFWVSFGVGLGATTAIVTTRWTRRQVQKASPQAIAREARGGIADLSRLASASLDAGRRAADAREQELRARYGAADERSASHRP